MSLKALNESLELYRAKKLIEIKSKEQAALLEFSFDKNVSVSAFSTQILFCLVKDLLTDRLCLKGISDFKRQDKYGSLANESDLIRVQKTRPLVLTRNRNDLMRLGLPQSPYAENLEKVTEQRRGYFPGYKYDDLSYQTVENSARNTGLRIIAIFKDGMIVSPKKVGGGAIKDAYCSYAEYLNEQSDVNNPEQWLYNLFNVASLEENLCISFVYRIAQYMQSHGTVNLPEDSIQYLCAVCQFTPLSFRIQSRFLALRNSLVPFVCESKEEHINGYFQKLLLLHWSVHRLFRDDTSLSVAVERIPAEQLVTHFKRAYSLFEFSCSPSDFSPQFVKKLRAAAKIVIDPAVYPSKTGKVVLRSE